MYFFFDLSHCVKKFWAFISNFGLFYYVHSPNMVMPRDPSSKVGKFLTLANFASNFSKSHKRSGGKVLYFRSYYPKTSRARTPSAFRGNYRACSV